MGNTLILQSFRLWMAVCAVNLPAQARYGGGSGTVEDPYQIATAADLLLLGDNPQDYERHFVLTDDIDLEPNLPGGRVFDRAVIAAREHPLLSGDQLLLFSGIFDGRGHRIMNLRVSGTGDLGLFGRLGQSAVVLNLGLEDVRVVGTEDRVGALAGSNGGTVGNSYSTGAVRGPQCVGGLVGENDGTVSGGHSAGTVGGTGWSIGGLAGSNWGTVSDSSSAGSVSGIQDIGGLVGENRGTISTSCSTGTVSGYGYAGGLVGCNWGAVSNTYSMAAVSGNEDLGGLVGWNSFGGAVSNSYSTGLVTGGDNVGGLIGYNDATVTNSFWDTSTSGRTTSAGGTGQTTAALQSPQTFLDAGWDFAAETANGTEDLWWITEAQDYPRLWWETAP